MARYAISGLALAGLWLLLSGYFHDPLLLSFGAASVVLCIFLSHRARVLDEEGAPVAMLPRVFGYWLWLLVEIAKANIAVARQALAVTPRLSPRIVRVPTTQKTNAGRTVFANSITLTPGTVSIDVGEGEIVVHALTDELADIAALADMGARVTRAEGATR